ncbi:fimbrial protein [Enterobacter hormaechei]
MKKICLLTMLPVLLSATSAAVAAPVTVDGGQINFVGSIVAAPCALDNASDGQTVQLGQVPNNRLAKKGDSSSAVPFTIKLIGCELNYLDSNSDPAVPASYTSASITFNGATTGDSTTLAISAGNGGAGDTTSTAQNVGIQILQNNIPVTVDGSTATASQNIYAGANEIPFSAAYVATGDNVVAGTANALVNFKINYE